MELPEVGTCFWLFVFLIHIHTLRPKARVKKGYVGILRVKSVYEGQHCDCVVLSTKPSTRTLDLLFMSVHTDCRP